MRISIITVCYNSESTIRDTIESVLAQTYYNIEYIVVDGQSNDKTLDIINEYSDRIDTVVSESDQGIYDAMNKGITMATGDVIGILNSDDFYLNEKIIAEVVTAYKQAPSIDMVFAGVDFVYDGYLNKVVRSYRAIGFKHWMLRFGLMPPHPGSFIRRDVYKEIGDYKINYKISADFDFFVRALLIQRFNYLTVDSVWVRMRVGGVSTSGLQSYKISTQEMLRSFKENRLYTNVLFLLIRLPIKALQLINLKR